MPISEAPCYQLSPDDADLKEPNWDLRRLEIKSKGPFIMGGAYDALTGENQSMLCNGETVMDDVLSSMTMGFAMCGLETQRFLTPVSVIPKEAGAGVASSMLVLILWLLPVSLSVVMRSMMIMMTMVLLSLLLMLLLLLLSLLF